MKTLIVLSVLQLTLLATILYITMQGQSVETALVSKEAADEALPHKDKAELSVSAGSSALNENSVRRIIRSELREYLGQIQEVSANDDDESLRVT